MDFVMEKEALVEGTSNGHLLLYNVDDNATKTVGRVEGGVKCISPSPDGDLLAVVTGFGQILVMTHDWDLLYETSIEEPTEEIDARRCSIQCTDLQDGLHDGQKDCVLISSGRGRFFILQCLHSSSKRSTPERKRLVKGKQKKAPDRNIPETAKRRL
ncbi:hypothetical protein POM88_008253 [Heracleum sosnowskyi]|uniref:Elongator complex protein 1 n=1 Tax=Heracleum sosnowskyi TaxID=360622 RepID=A0AAD8J5V0_9APIA|nr:hypothetical protein POM88_008253 [Heracleum sosnowskyi]